MISAPQLGWALTNYIFAFTDRIMLEAFRNNLLWMIFGTSFSVGLGLLIAVLADRSRFEIGLQSDHLHADGHLLRRRGRDLEICLHLQRRRRQASRKLAC